MKHSELGQTYLTLLEAVKQTGLSEAEVVLHSEEVWMYCPRVPRDKEKVTDVESDGHPTWLGDGQVLGKDRGMPVCAKLTDHSKEQLYIRLKKSNYDLKGLKVIDETFLGETEEVELQKPNPFSIPVALKIDPNYVHDQPILYVTRSGLEQYVAASHFNELTHDSELGTHKHDGTLCLRWDHSREELINLARLLEEHNYIESAEIWCGHFRVLGENALKKADTRTIQWVKNKKSIHLVLGGTGIKLKKEDWTAHFGINKPGGRQEEDEQLAAIIKRALK